MVIEASRRFGGKPHNCHKGPKRRDRTDRATRCQPHPQPSRTRSIDGAAPSSTAISLTGTAIGAAWTDTAPSADKPEVDDHLSGGGAARTARRHRAGIPRRYPRRCAGERRWWLHPALPPHFEAINHVGGDRGGARQLTERPAEQRAGRAALSGGDHGSKIPGLAKSGR
jgi:hypothetical protein